MTKHLKILAAALALSVALAAPVFAEGNGFNDGFVTLYMKDGGTMQKTISDAKLLADLVKSGTEIPAGSMIISRGGKSYLVHDGKMADGSMMYDRVMTFR